MGTGTGGAGNRGQGAGAGDAGGAQAYKLTPDSLVDFGDGKPVKWSSVVDTDTGRYYSKDRYDRGVQYLTQEAQRLQKAWDDYRAGVGQRPNKAEPQQQARDPFEDVYSMPVVDGATVKRIVETMKSQGFGPVAQVISQMASRLQQLEGKLTSTGQQLGSLAEKDSSTEFESYVTRSLTDVGQVKGLPEGVTLDPKDPFLREAAKDLFLSHEQDSWKKGEFQKALQSRVESLIGFVRQLDKRAVEAGQEKRRSWINPRKGNASPNGNVPYQHRRGAEVARAIFGSVEQPT